MLALAGPDGFVPGSVPGLANIFRVSVEQMRSALTTFESPDPDSRTKDNEGRRIEAIDGGWILLNHAKHREKKDPEIRKQQVREAVARHRANKKQGNQTVNNVINVSQSKPKSEVRSQITEAEKSKHKPSSVPSNGQLSDADFLQRIRENIAFAGIDIDRELARMDAWFLTPKGRGRKKTRRFIVAWLNKIDRPLTTSNEETHEARMERLRTTGTLVDE